MSENAPPAPKIRRALISVSDKAGLVAFARALAERGVEILSTGGTARTLKDAGIAVKDVAEHTGFPEMMDGRLKTLHPKVHGGLLAIRGNAEHDKAAAAHGIAPIDLLVVNLYPFEATAAKGAGLRRVHREYRHRRAGDDPRGRQEPRWRHRRRRPGGLWPCARRHGRPWWRHQPRPAQVARGQGLRAHRRLRCGNRRLVRSAAGRADPALANVCRAAGAGAALRREPAPVGGVLRVRRAAPRSGDGRAASGQGALLQQPQRYGRCLRAGRRVRPEGLASRCHHQARQPVRCRRRRNACRSVCQGPALRPHQRLRRHHRPQRHDRCGHRQGDHRHLHRGCDRARRHGRGQGDLRREKEPASAHDRRPARPQGARHYLPLGRPAGSSFSRATTPWSTIWT